MKSRIEELWDKQEAPRSRPAKSGSTLNDFAFADNDPGKVFFSPAPDRGIPAWLPFALWTFLFGLAAGRLSRRRHQENNEENAKLWHAFTKTPD